MRGQFAIIIFQPYMGFRTVMSKGNMKLFWLVLAGFLVMAFLAIGIPRFIGAPSSGNQPLAGSTPIMAGTVIRVTICFLTTEGYGNLSTERVVVRGRTLACTNANQAVAEALVQGYLVDSDGKVGLHGKLVATDATKLLATAGLPKGQIDAATASLVPVISVAGPQKAALVITKTINPTDWVKRSAAEVAASFGGGRIEALVNEPDALAKVATVAQVHECTGRLLTLEVPYVTASNDLIAGHYVLQPKGVIPKGTLIESVDGGKSGRVIGHQNAG